MRRCWVPPLLALFFAGTCITTLAQNPSQGQSRYFDPAEMMNIGVYYYPEAWPESHWARDYTNIRKLGLEYVHLGEFAWAFMEPEEHKYDFDWLERNVKLAAAQGLKVVLCTPSATPPAWLVRDHPEVLMIDAAGRRMNHGSREQACWNVPAYRQRVGKMVSELGKRFGNNPNVWGWQIDNELSHYGKSYCYDPSCQKRFRQWLKKKYGTIDALNRDWGDAFWSQMYQDWDQIDIPNPQELVADVNPHALLDFQRWFAEDTADYIKFQADELRKYTKNQWITTNFMFMHRDVYPPLSGKSLDAITFTIYPVHGELNEGPLGFRLGNGEAMSFMHDFLRPINGNEGIMELQPGQVNWGNVNPQVYPGAIRMWILRAFAAGSKLVCTYRYRQPLYGSELYHKGLVETDGVTPSVGGLEYSQAIKDIQVLRAARKPDAKEPEEYAQRRAALLYNVENRWDLDNHKQTDRWDTMGHILKYYAALKSLGAPVDVVGEDADFAHYRFLVAPAYQLIDEKLVDRWTQYVTDGGHLVLSSRTGQKDRRGHLWEALWAGPIQDLIGAAVTGYDVLPAPLKGLVKTGEKSYEWGVWGDFLQPRPGTTSLAYYADQFYSGQAAATTRRLGKGTVTYIGVETFSRELESDLLRNVYAAAGIPVQNFDNQFFVDWRDGFWVATNFSSRKQVAPVKEGAKILIGSREVEPGGVTVWAE